MKLTNLEEKALLYTLPSKDEISIEKTTCGEKHPFRKENSEKYLRFLFSTSALNLYLEGQEKPQFVSERAAIKVHPNVPISFEIKKGADVYMVRLYQDEKTYLDNLVKYHKGFFDGLKGRDKTEWEAVVDKDLDHILEGERNSEHVRKLEGVVIAPTHSRFKDMEPIGWLLMYARASKTLSIASNHDFKPREKERIHSHELSTEFYITSEGYVDLEVNGKNHRVKTGYALCLEPGDHADIHGMVNTSKPWVGFVLQTPSVPGDKKVY